MRIDTGPGNDLIDLSHSASLTLEMVMIQMLIPVEIRLRFLIVLRLFNSIYNLLKMFSCVNKTTFFLVGYAWEKQAFTIISVVNANPCWVCDEKYFIEPTLMKRDSGFGRGIHALYFRDV